MLHDPSDDLAMLPDWARKERPMASMLPYVSLVNDVTIRTRGNALFQCIRIDGVNSMTSDDAHLEKIRTLFAAIIAQIGPEYSFCVHKVSKAIETALPPVPNEGFAQALDTRWQTAMARVMLSLAYGCGLRAGEIVRLKVGDIDSDQEIIRIVQSKGRKDRNVMLPDDILGLLRDWWTERPTGQDRDVPGPDRVLFPGYRGRHLSARQISRLFKQAARAAGITKPVTLHTLRHSFATHLLERGVDIRVIQALLGHTKLTTTARYASVAPGMISAVESPLDDLTGAKRKKGKKGAS